MVRQLRIYGRVVEPFKVNCVLAFQFSLNTKLILRATTVLPTNVLPFRAATSSLFSRMPKIGIQLSEINKIQEETLDGVFCVYDEDYE
ncbi:hypothetical protein OUZ56_031181 [Daphnia magna]|uniref:Uncharacterized protein n=1 Tax=Daphnia magna TaxID=35525 RepID=A0ABQ9ZTI5_9CRUS|nr:hypothetical protein OUZ56_031181 [Daphnia magna]